MRVTVIDHEFLAPADELFEMITAKRLIHFRAIDDFDQTD